MATSSTSAAAVTLVDHQFIELLGIFNQWVLISWIAMVVVLIIVGFLHYSVVNDINKAHALYQKQIQNLTDRLNKIKPPGPDPFKK
jgi:hypothetical protein